MELTFPQIKTAQKPLLRWAGSKRKLLPYLRKYWSDHHEKYLEPFTGSACLFLDLMPAKAVLSDINKDLIDTYKILKKYPKRLHSAVSSIPKSEVEYYKTRAQDLSNLSSLDKAARFIYLNRFCFNGLYRTNNQGKFNVPYGHSRTGDIPKLEVFQAISNSLQHVDLISGDFEKIIDENLNKGDFIYLDPPYAVRNKRIFTQYDANSFGLNDLTRLSLLLDRIDAKNADFVLSYAYCDEAIELFGKWKYEIVEAQRNISGFANHRKKDQEIIVTNITYKNKKTNV